jgi:hypothetical protein
MSLLSKKSLIAASLEAAVGTAETLDAGDSVFIATNPTITPEADEHPRQAPGTLSPLADVIGARRGTASFEIEMQGKGSAGSPAWAEVFLPAIGMYLDTATWKLVSGAPGTESTTSRTVTVAQYVDGMRMLLAGAMASSARIVLENGMPPKLALDLIGKYSAVSDATMLAPTLPSIVPTRCNSLTLTIGAKALRCNRIEIDFGLETVLRQDVAEASGYFAGCITGRRIVVNVEPEAALVATRDDYGLWLAGTLEAVSIVVGTVQYNTFTIAIPKAQRLQVRPGDREGVMTTSMSILATRNAANDDEMTLAFS